MKQKETQELLEARLREKGLKVTRQRMLVLRTLAEHGGSHMTAEDIYGQIRTEYPKIGLATVYRTLQLFLEMQLVDHINLDDGCVRYEIGHLCEDDTRHNHHHLICRTCGRVFPFEDDLLDELESHIEETAGFRVLDHELKFFGRCRECAGKEM